MKDIINMIKPTYFLLLIAVLFSFSVFAQPTHVFTDAERKFKDAKELFIKQQYALAYPLLEVVKKEYPDDQKSNNVYLHDATHFRLSTHLSKAFPGNFTKGCTRAVAKIQTVFNLTKGIFTYFQITSFADPDIRCVEAVNARLQKGDLIIRDLGYFGLSGFEQIIKSNAFLLSRFKQLVVVKDVITRQPICLWKALKKTTCFDTQVLIGAEHEIKVRMVAKKLPQAVADERRRKAKRSRRLTHEPATLAELRG